MAITIGEAARRAGVSVRTLRHCDQIGLLAPSGETEGGYRLYDEPALMRLEQILYLKELGFALEDIRAMMTRPDDDAGLAMRRQRELLILKRRRLDGMIARLDRAIAGDTQTELEVFDMTEYNKHKDRYAEEAKRRWGGTPAYEESREKERGRTDAQRESLQRETEEIFRAFADARALDAGDARVQALVARWQAFITRSYYACSKEMLAGLGQMYTADERFAKNLDRYGEGTASLMSRAIEIYCAQA